MESVSTEEVIPTTSAYRNGSDPGSGDAFTGSLRAFLSDTETIVERATFGEGDAAFDVDFRRVDKRELEALIRESVRTIKSRSGVREEQDTKRFREGLRERCLIGWHGLTLGKVAIACNRRLDPASPQARQVVPFTPDAALVLLETARGTVDGELMAFDAWVLDHATRIADAQAREEADGKNG